MHRGARNYRPLATATGELRPSSSRISRSPVASTRRLAHQNYDPQLSGVASAMIDARNHHENVDPAVTELTASPSRRHQIEQEEIKYRQLTMRRQKSSSSSSSSFNYEREVEKLLTAPQRHPVTAAKGAPSFVIVASSSIAEDGSVPVALAASFDRARATASSFWHLPKYNDGVSLPRVVEPHGQERYSSRENTTTPKKQLSTKLEAAERQQQDSSSRTKNRSASKNTSPVLSRKSSTVVAATPSKKEASVPQPTAATPISSNSIKSPAPTPRDQKPQQQQQQQQQQQLSAGATTPPVQREAEQKVPPQPSPAAATTTPTPAATADCGAEDEAAAKTPVQQPVES